MSTTQETNIREIDIRDEEQWKYLLLQLSPNKVPKLRLDWLRTDHNFFGIVIDVDGIAIGFGSISFFQSSLKGKAGVIEDIIVDKNYQGMGYGRKILRRLIEEAKKRMADLIVLTSNPSREIARGLYESEGFSIYSTGFFTLQLNK